MADKSDPKPTQSSLPPVGAQTAQPGSPSPQTGPVASPTKPEEGEDVTYLPGPGDPASVAWRGHMFKANVPKRIANPEHLEAARGNRFFRVGAGDTEDMGRNPNDPPSSNMEYRSHVVAWLKPCETTEDVVKHWSDDRQLRQSCDVGEDDIKWLGTLAGPKLMEFKRREGKTEAQVAEVWIKYGFVEIPWRG